MLEWFSESVSPFRERDRAFVVTTCRGFSGSEFHRTALYDPWLWVMPRKTLTQNYLDPWVCGGGGACLNLRYDLPPSDQSPRDAYATVWKVFALTVP